MDQEKKRTTRASYVIHVKDHLDTLWEGWFAGVAITHRQDGVTILRLQDADQSRLHGLLDQIFNFNLTLLEVKRMDADL